PACVSLSLHDALPIYQRIIYGVSVFLKFLLYFLFRFLLICLSIRVITGYLRRIWIGKGFIILAWFLKNIFWFFFDSTRSKSQQQDRKSTRLNSSHVSI